MIVTTYTCDKCGHEQNHDVQMWDIGITVREKPSKNYSQYANSPKESALWCRKCTQSLGLLPQKKTDPPTPKPTPTFEDMIREIIQEEMDSSQ